MRTTPKMVCVGIAAAAMLAFGLPAVAHAETSADLQAQLDAANSKLDELNTNLLFLSEGIGDAQYQLDQTGRQIDDTNQQISDTTQKIGQTNQQVETEKVELATAQKALSARVSSDYKSGNVTFLSMVLDSTSFDDFVSRIYYADKISQASAAAIDDVKSIKADLENTQAQLESQQADLQAQKDQLESQQASQAETLSQQQAQKAEFSQQQAEQQSYVDNLSSEVKQKLEEEKQAELARQKAAAAAATSSGTSSSGGASSSGGGSSSGAVSSGWRQTVVDAVWSQIGVSYGYGSASPGVAFDCSGLASWAYGQAGLSIPHSTSGIYSSMRQISASELQPGDIVVWIGGMNAQSGNHTAVYVGNDTIVHALWQGVSSNSLSNLNWGRSPTAYLTYG